ncbi:MAG TPA: ABC transporter substrate-binding protein [Candidatus Bathyarchaeia archaeon]|nr:ABC transporter substrate-binding protein [Candidatus Bathyarchaeia archaeon]
MDNSMLKRVCLTVICISMLAAMFSISPAFAQQRGPKLDLYRLKVTRSPAAQLIEMTTGASEAWDGLIRPTDIEEMDRQGKVISSRGGFHYCRIILNYRVHPLDDANFRHALFHLVPKDRIIGNLFKYIVVKVDTPVPPAQALWYNPAVDPHAYSPTEAEAILAAAGYQKIGGEWKDTDGSNLPTLRFFVPLEVVAPTSYTIGRMVVEEAQGIGLNNIDLQPTDFATYVDKTFNLWDYEMSWVCHGLGRFPTHLFYQFSSEENYLGSGNPHGIVYPALDAKLSTLLRSLNHADKVIAVREAQVLLMGGSSSSPMPQNVPATDQALPTVPIYSRNYYDIQQPYLRGAVNMFGYGIANGWTMLNIEKTADPNGHGAKTLVWIEDEFPERLNPTWASTVYAWDFMENSFDGLMATNPFTHRDEPWLASNVSGWSYATEPGGMAVTFNIRLNDLHGSPVQWADGDPVQVSDIKFSWDFLKNNTIPAYWGAFRFFKNATIVDADTIVAHMTTTSQWLVYDLAGTAYLLPPQVWTVDPRDGLPWVNTAEITSFDPSALAYPDPDGGGPLRALPNHLFGTGPFILQHSTAFMATNAYGDQTANRNYWLTTADIDAIIEDMFWRSGDTVDNDEVDITDLDLIATWFGQNVPPAPVNADITRAAGGPPDTLVDIDDLATTGKYFGETESVP